MNIKQIVTVFLLHGILFTAQAREVYLSNKSGGPIGFSATYKTPLNNKEQKTNILQHNDFTLLCSNDTPELIDLKIIAGQNIIPLHRHLELTSKTLSTLVVGKDGNITPMNNTKPSSNWPNKLVYGPYQKPPRPSAPSIPPSRPVPPIPQ